MYFITLCAVTPIESESTSSTIVTTDPTTNEPTLTTGYLHCNTVNICACRIVYITIINAVTDLCT